MLSDQEIQNARRWHGLVIDGFVEDRLQAASYDVRLHPVLLLLREGRGPLDPRVDTAAEWEEVELGEDGILLAPRHFALGSTVERLEVPVGLVGQLEGKSSLGRLGLMVHSTAGYLDPGFVGQVTLELSCVQPRGVILYPFMPIGQIAFDGVYGVERPYRGKYVEQAGPTPSRYHENWNGLTWR